MRIPRGIKRPAVWVPASIAALAVLVIALAAFQPWRLFIDVTVNEDLPTVAIEQPAEATESADSADPADSIQPTQAASEGDAADIASAPNQAPSDEPTPEVTPKRTVTAEGTFIAHEHPTAGTARIITLEDGSRVLRLVGLDTDNGPDLKVWLAAAPVIEGRDGWFVFDDDDYLSLGALKGNKGNQNYPIPDDADISDLTSVTIWCERFSVSFGAAELQPA